MYGQVLAEGYFRLDKAMTAFFRRLKNGEPPGFPRVRPRHPCFTRCYPARHIKVEGNRVVLPTGGKSEKTKRFSTLGAGLTEDGPAGYKEGAIRRDARGHDYASFVYLVQEETPTAGQGVAFDWASKRWLRA